jgi:hypothetical protein
VLLGFALLAAAPILAFAQDTGGPEFSLSPDASEPVLVLSETPTELVDVPPRVLRVFADGHCELDVPEIMRGAGHYEWDVSPDVVEALTQQALAAGVHVLEPAALRASLRASRVVDDSLGQTYRFDDEVIEFEVNVARYRSAPGAAWSRLRRRVKWIGLRSDRARHPQDDRLQRLMGLRDELDAMGTAYLEREGKFP